MSKLSGGSSDKKKRTPKQEARKQKRLNKATDIRLSRGRRKDTMFDQALEAGGRVRKYAGTGGGAGEPRSFFTPY